jgi:cytochrome c biogenesis protein CcdA
VSVLFASVVDAEALLKVVLASMAAALAFSVSFSLAILGTTRFVDLRRDERQLEAAAFGLLALVCLLVSIAAVVIGLIAMTSK